MIITKKIEDGRVFVVANQYYLNEMGLTNKVPEIWTDTEIYVELEEFCNKVTRIECFLGGGIMICENSKHEESKVFAFGTNQHGELGIGSREQCHSPTELASLRGKKIQQISAGAYHVLALV